MIRQTTVSAPSQMNAKVGYTTISPAMREMVSGASVTRSLNTKEEMLK